MCLYIDTDKHIKRSANRWNPLIAKKDMHVWKVINSDNISVFLDFPYTPNTEYSVESFGFRNATVERGFHSYRTRDAAREQKCGWDDTKLVKFIIPKGTEYFIGEDDEYASLKIISGDLKPCR